MFSSTDSTVPDIPFTIWNWAISLLVRYVDWTRKHSKNQTECYREPTEQDNNLVWSKGKNGKIETFQLE
jgi:hypothetical protein